MVHQLPKRIIPLIEHALGITLYANQVHYILDGDTWAFGSTRASGRTTAHIIRLALKTDEALLDMNRPEDFSDGWELSNHISYARNHYRPTFLEIYHKLKDYGMPVRELKNYKEEIKMNTYKVSYWWGNGKGEADRVVYVETDSVDRTEIKRLGLQQLQSYPRSYQVLVEKVERAMDTYYVIKIKLDDMPHGRTWYKERDGELVVVHKDNKGRFVTAHTPDESSTYGLIDPDYCQVVTTFKVEEE